eukprot:gnl/MRDRNA2_/MRDRNA2_110219_c0_seq1.p1 gnl/MRDRNA2_/MRDRNA2_110219_c0~~gnl/MRDRNA2_/MRDRNA2_110219_c0_seq1.p1  ORF type:complete len:219 (-),score=27.35 gnl/MRDRNA2_/MRDRNA2_110219_c0_seq1:75-731(-)
MGRSKNPGPGHYNVPNNFGRGAQKACSLHGRVLQPSVDDTPGPGEYVMNNLNLKANAKWGFGSSTRRGLANMNLTPGPGEYTPRDPRVVSTKSVMGVSARKSAMSEVDTFTPGPGAYSPVGIKDTVRKAAVLAQKANRMEKLSDGNLESPGPAAYACSRADPVRIRAPSHGFGTAQRHVDASHGTFATLVPGPGTYEPKQRSKGPKISITPRRPEPEF